MFGFNDWPQWEAGGFRTRAGAIAKVLSEHPRIGHLLVVSTPHSFAMNLVRSARGSAAGLRAAPTTLRFSELRRLTPKVAVLDHSRLLPREACHEAVYRTNGALHDRTLRSSVRRACRDLGMGDFVLWVGDPLMTKHLGRLAESVSVFDAIDDWSAHPENHAMRGSITQGYDRARAKADIIFTVSRALQERLGGRDRVFWEPNGVDVSRFEGKRRVPDELADLPRPILGYVGVIQERLDVDGLLRLAQEVPEASIVLVGPVLSEDHVRPLRHCSSVHFLGERASSVVPDYIHQFDVCLVPHVVDELTRSMDPLKVYEYLAAGKPVVATGVADMSIPPGLVCTEPPSGDLAGAVRSALAESAGNGSLSQARRDFARSRSWVSRVDEMLGIIDEFDDSRMGVR